MKVCISTQWWPMGWSMPMCLASKIGWLRTTSPFWPTVRDDHVKNNCSSGKKGLEQTHPASTTGWNSYWSPYNFYFPLSIACFSLSNVCLSIRVQTWLLTSSWRLWKNVALKQHMLWNSGMDESLTQLLWLRPMSSVKGQRCMLSALSSHTFSLYRLHEMADGELKDMEYFFATLPTPFSAIDSEAYKTSVVGE